MSIVRTILSFEEMEEQFHFQLTCLLLTQILENLDKLLAHPMQLRMGHQQVVHNTNLKLIKRKVEAYKRGNKHY